MPERPELPAAIATRADLDAFLAATTNYEEKRPRDPLRKALDLGRVEALLASVGDPQRGPRTVHIAGSKGKGTVARMVASGLRAAGRGPVGLFTSPHLEDLAERIDIDGTPASDAAMCRAATRVLPHARAVRDTPDAATFFELFTAIAWLVFQEHGCSDVVLETGMGGRLDSTNVCAPAATVITLIELEHTHLLGDTVAQIAGEKAGILKPGVPAITTPQDPEALAVIAARADALDAPLTVADGPVPREVRLPGVHHTGNARAAFEALRILGIDEATAWRGIDAVRLPGILEVLGGNPRVVIDGAHTRRSAEATRAAMAARSPGETIVLVLALLEGKDLASVAGALAADVKHVVVTRVDSPRCIPPADLAGRIEPYVSAPITVRDDLAAALEHARKLAGPDGTVLASGSIYLAGAVRTLLT